MAVVALKPRRQYSFTDHAVHNPAAPPPGDRLDGEVDRIHAAIGQLVDFLSVSFNADGTLKAPPAAPSARSAAAPVGVLGGNETHSIIGADPNALAMDWAEVSFEWAEHMPDTIPPNILATMGITGDHWSARWWAHRAMEIVHAPPGQPGLLLVTATATIPPGFAGFVRVENAAGAPITVTMPLDPIALQKITVKDTIGDAGSNPITVLGGSNTIEGAASLIIYVDYGWVDLIYTGLQWVQT